ncbi:MAG TPA: dihydrodipicolinate synthase family protein [Blastocatellia bacterium]|nr:dihydrodipicolinate synthase family protein [Blastocatellia bacterium]
MSLNLNGVIAAVPTPFGYDGEVAYEKLTDNLRYWNGTDLHGILILGSTGEFPHLTTEEKLKVMETVRGVMPPEKLLLMGASELSTRQTIEMTKRAADQGADAALVVTPFYYKKLLTEEQLSLHYQRVADASPIPILIYLIPQFAGVYLMPETIAALAQHQNIIGLKESSGDMQALSDLFRELGPTEFSVMVGSPVIMHQAYSAGATGAILAAASAAPRACVELEKAYKWGDAERAKQLQERLAALARTIASPGVGHLKAAMDEVGLYGFLPRSPLPVPTDEEREQIRKAIEDSGFFSPREDGQGWVEKTEIE